MNFKYYLLFSYYPLIIIIIIKYIGYQKKKSRLNI